MKYSIHKLLLSIWVGMAIQSCTPNIKEYANGFDGPVDSTILKVDTATLLTNTSRYGQARLFPGLVCNDQRLDTTLQLNLDYHFVGNTLGISVPPVPLFSTGLYAAPGDLVTITVPEGEYSLTVQVGAWSDDLTSKQAEGPLLRDPKMVSYKALAPGENLVRNLYGGHIYIKPERPIAKPVTIKFKRVCKSPDFILGETTKEEWIQMVQNSCVPWLELRSKYIVFVVPRDQCLTFPIKDPVALMTEWEKAIREDFFGWMGLVENAAEEIDESPKLPYRVVFDVQPSVGYGHNGNPVVVTNDNLWFNFCTDLTWLKGSNVWGVYHEIGHNAQMKNWSWSTLGETSNNLFAYKLAHRNEVEQGKSSVWPAVTDCWTCTNSGVIAQAISFATEPSGAKNFDGTDARIDGPFNRLTPFLQIFDFIKPNMMGVNQSNQDGWAFMPYLYSQARRAVRPPTSDILKHDFLYTRLCDFTKMNWQLFFEAWGIQVSNLAIANMQKYPLMKKEVWKYNPISRTGGNTDASLFKIISVSSDNPAEGPAPMGRKEAMVDNNPGTFWLSNPNQIQFPHTAVFDNTFPSIMKGFKIQHRNYMGNINSAIRNLLVQVSNDMVSWTTVPGPGPSAGGTPLTFQTGNTVDLQTFTFSQPVNARYIRISCPSQADTWTTTRGFIAIAEFSVVYQ